MEKDVVIMLREGTDLQGMELSVPVLVSLGDDTSQQQAYTD